MSTPYPSPLKVGVFLAEAGIQFLDAAPLDMLGMLERSYVQGIAQVTNQPHLAADNAGLDIEYHFINETGESPNQMTGGFRIEVTDSISTCPPLDILLFPGPRPDYRPSPAVQKFMQDQSAHARAFLIVCTGYVPALYSGILDGKTATAPRELVPLLQKEAPNVKWVARRWVRDGKVWSSGAVANGQELMGAFMRSEFPELKEQVEMVLGMSDIAVRGQDYEA